MHNLPPVHNPIQEEIDLGDQKKEYKGKTIKIKKLIKKETGSYTLKDTYIHGEDSVNNSTLEGGNQEAPLLDPSMQGGMEAGMHPDTSNTYHQETIEQSNFNFSKSGHPPVPKDIRPSYQSAESQTLSQYNQAMGLHPHHFPGGLPPGGVPQGGITTTTTTTKTQVYEYNSDGVVRQGGMDQGPVPENFVSPRVSQAEYLQQPQTIHTSQTITHGGGVVHTNVPGPLPPLPVQVTGHQMGGAPPPRVVLVPGQAPPPPVVHLPPGSGIVTGNMPPQPGAPTGAPMPPLVVTPAPAVHSGVMSNSTTEFVDYFDPEKQVTKVTIVGGSQKPITEYVNRKNRLENNMFLSGYTTRPAGADRFQKMEESQVITTKTTTIIGEPQVRVKETLNTSNNVMNQSQSLGYNMADSNVMSTSTYIGNVVTNRVANMNRAANTSQRSSNVMYHSQTFRVGENRSANKNFKHDMKLFTVPDKVQNFINNCQNEIKYVERDVMAEKSKMNAELDVMQQTIQFIIEKKRAELNSMYDGYLQGFRTNVEVLKSKAVSFKDTTDWVKMQNSENGDRLVRLTDIAYYSKGTDGIYHHYRKDAHKSICELRNLKQEVNKHNLDFYVAELERMGIHHPAFANTASSAEYLAEVKANLFKNVQTGFDDFGKLAYTAQHVLFSEILAEPQIFTSLGESRLNCLTNMRDLSSNSVISSRMAPLSHTQPITTLMNVDDESLATGDMEGTINIFNHLLWKETHKFKMNGVSPITSLGRIRTTYELVSGGEQMIHSENEIKEKHDKNIFLISGHAKPDCVITIWDMKRQCFVKQLTGHTDDVTSISSLQDGHTIISGSMAGTTHIFSITKKKPIKSFQSLVNSPVNVIYTFNDLAKFAIGYDNGEVTICSILYEIHPIEKMAICASADPVGTLKAKSPVLCINESHTNPNTIITGHEDKIVRIWDSASQQIMKELSSNLTPVISTLVIENPFSFNLEENYHIISCGENQDDIYFNLPKHNKQFQLRFEMGIDLRGTKGRNPKVQLYREKKEESEQGINFATFINGADNSRQIALITIR